MFGVKFRWDKVGFWIAFLVLMNIHIWILEDKISVPKVAFLAQSCLFAFMYSRYGNKAFFTGSVFYIVSVLCVSMTSINLRYSTVLYLGLYVYGFIGFYCLTRKLSIPLGDVLDVLRNLIYAFAIVLFIQQICAALDIRTIYLNMFTVDSYNRFKLNSLGIEPSSSARVVCCSFLAYMKLTNLTKYYSNFKDMFFDNKLVIYSVVYICFGIGSTTAIMLFFIILTYFVKKQFLVYVVLLISLFYVVSLNIEWKPLNRALVTIEAAVTGEQENIAEADGSASARTAYYFSTIEYFDPLSINYWFGHGIEQGQEYKQSITIRKDNQIGGIYQYGFLSYILGLFFLYSCAFKFFTLENIIFFFFLGGGIGNIAYAWGCIMLFSLVKYYKPLYRDYVPKKVKIDSDKRSFSPF